MDIIEYFFNKYYQEFSISEFIIYSDENVAETLNVLFIYLENIKI